MVTRPKGGGQEMVIIQMNELCRLCACMNGYWEGLPAALGWLLMTLIHAGRTELGYIWMKLRHAFELSHFVPATP